MDMYPYPVAVYRGKYLAYISIECATAIYGFRPYGQPFQGLGLKLFICLICLEHPIC